MAIDLDPLAGPDGGDKGRRLAAHWQDQINAIKSSSEYKRWYKRGEGIEKRYRDERNRTDDGVEVARRYNALWSNVEILKPALYGRTPLPVAERRFRDKDPVGRAATSILERALRNEIEINGYDEAMQRAVSDFLLPGRGVVWVRYEPVISESVSLPVDPQEDMRDAEGQIGTTDTDPVVTPKGRVRPTSTSAVPDAQGEPDPEAEEEKLESTGDRIVRESTPIDFILWSDFMTFPARARTWKEVTAIAKRVYMSRDQLIKRFGKKIGRDVPLEKDNRGHRDQNTTLQAQNQDKAQVYEVWDKDSLTLYWVAIGYMNLLDRKEDPLGLENFFPVPRPIYANPTNNTLIPVPDFIQYQDQAFQIDDLTQRIAMLTKACKMTGLYNAAQKDIQRIFNESVENQLIPVDDWAAFAEKGGIESNWSLMPVKDIIGIVNELMMCKEKQIEEMNQLTGINDIMRGTSDARETLGGVRLKRNSTGTRLTSRQNEVARMCRDTIRIMADIMCQHFSPQSLIETSGALQDEGLSPDDMPDLSAMQDPASMAPAMPPTASGPQPGAAPAGPPPMGAPPMPPAPTPAPPMGAQMPPQGNVVPFRPPGSPMPGQPPMGGPQPPMGMPPQPQIPPEVLQKMQTLQKIASAIELLRNERLRGFRVDIEVDSTIYPDAEQDKQDRTEFLASMTQFLQTSLAMGATAPEAIPLLSKMLEFGVRGWRVGRSLEAAIDEFGDQAVGMAKKLIQQRASQPNPEQMKAQTEQMKAQAQIQSIQIKSQAEDRSNQAEMARQQLENQGEQRNAEIDRQSNELDLQMKLIDKRIEEMRMQMEMWKMRHEMQMSQQDMHLKGADMLANHQQASHEQAMSEEELSHTKEMHKHEKTMTKKEMAHDEAMAKHEKAIAAQREAKATK